MVVVRPDPNNSGNTPKLPAISGVNLNKQIVPNPKTLRYNGWQGGSGGNLNKHIGKNPKTLSKQLPTIPIFTPIYLPSNSIVGRVGPGGQLNPPYSPPTPISLKSQVRRATDNMSDGWAPRRYKRKQRTNKPIRKPVKRVVKRVRRK
jgi:hypothetical protein